MLSRYLFPNYYVFTYIAPKTLKVQMQKITNFKHVAMTTKQIEISNIFSNLIEIILLNKFAFTYVILYDLRFHSLVCINVYDLVSHETTGVTSIVMHIDTLLHVRYGLQNSKINLLPFIFLLIVVIINRVVVQNKSR